MSKNSFQSLPLAKPILRAVAEEGYTVPTPIQLQTIPVALSGGDVLATAQTGTGKTAAFALPILQKLGLEPRRNRRPVRALILTPTRELALQIERSFDAYGRHTGIRTDVVLGGVSAGSQINRLQKGADVLVATPGRLLDLLERGAVKLDRVEILVLDEADRMLDMGFIADVRRIVARTPRSRQTMFFSATLPGAIVHLASDMLKNPTHVSVTPPASVSQNIDQKVLYVERTDKLSLLAEVLEKDGIDRTLIFTRTKHRAEHLMRQLTRRGIRADSIHSNKNQKERQRALTAFDRGRIKVLVATDIVARGIDVESISHVVNFELPTNPESYVHRIGRTARAGAEGTALSFCDFEEVPLLRAIERFLDSPMTSIDDHPFHAPTISRLGRFELDRAGSHTRRRRRSSGRIRMGGSRRRPR